MDDGQPRGALPDRRILSRGAHSTPTHPHTHTPTHPHTHTPTQKAGWRPSGPRPASLRDRFTPPGALDRSIARWPGYLAGRRWVVRRVRVWRAPATLAFGAGAACA